MKVVMIAALAALSLASTANAARPDTRKMTCAQAKDFVEANGPVVMTTGYSDKAGWLYSRLSANECRRSHDDQAQAAWVQTLDSPSCFVGYHCNF